MMDWMKLLAPLTKATGISGDEGAVRAAILSLLPEHLTYEIDALGNLIVYKPGKSRELLLLSAHMDEPGLLVETADEKGGLRFTCAGEIDERVLAGRQVWVHTNERAIPGVIGVKPVHVISSKERETAVEADDLFIDIGCKKKEEALQLVQPGDSVTFDGDLIPFGDNLLRGRALESRSGCALLIELLRSEETFPCDIAAVFTTQRRTGSAGMKTAAFALQPKAAVILEASPSAFGTDSPALSKGAVLTLKEKRGFYDRDAYRAALEAAKKLELPVQQKTGAFDASDAAAAQLAGKGCPTLELGIPTRNTGTPCCIQSIADLDSVYRLLCALVREDKL